MLRTNRDRLIKISVMGVVSSPVIGESIYKISAEGEPVILPGVGGITYNLRVGDLACGWMADHVEPGVSIERITDPRMQGQSRALNVLSCIGNEALVVEGDAKGEKGVVVGKHGGIEHVMIDFPLEVMDKLVVDQKVMIKAYGVGLRLLELPEIQVFNTDPRLLEAMDLKIIGGKLEIPVTHTIPAAIMGSGLGANHVSSGDYDITLFDDAIVEKYGLNDLRLGDLVAILDADNSYGRIYRQGAVTVGIVSHTNCIIAGHGPGVTTLLTSKSGKIRPIVDENANIAKILKIRDY